MIPGLNLKKHQLAICIAALVACGGAPAPRRPATCPFASSSVTPEIASQAAWDAKFNPQYGGSLPSLSGSVGDHAWHGHYWLRAYVSRTSITPISICRS